MKSQRKLSPLHLKVFIDTRTHKTSFYFMVYTFVSYLLLEPEPPAKEEPKPKPTEKAKKTANNRNQVGFAIITTMCGS